MVHSARENIRAAGLVAVILLALLALLRPAHALPPAESIEQSVNTIRSRATDLKQLSEGLMSNQDRQITLFLQDGARDIRSDLQCLHELLLIQSLMDCESDKRQIEPLISTNVKYLAQKIDPTIKFINREIAAAQNQAVINTASKLKDDLRELKELLAR
jgi:hypothetical protein